MFADSHAHLDSFRSPEELASAIERARAAGVTMIVAVGGNDEGNRCAAAAAAQWPGLIRASAGYDRDQTTTRPRLAGLASALDEPGFCAVGEIGLDYHYHPETAREQKMLFEAQLDLARTRGLPVIVHTREADADTLRLLADHARRWQGPAEGLGVIHCFTGSAAFAERLTGLGYHLGFSGIITFRNAADLRHVAAKVPERLLLVETDTPYLAPVPYRGKPNEPAWVVEVARYVAQVRDCSLEEVAAITAANTRRLFGFSDTAA